MSCIMQIIQIARAFIIQIASGKHVRKSRALQIPPAKHSIGLVNHVDQGDVCPEGSRS